MNRKDRADAIRKRLAKRKSTRRVDAVSAFMEKHGEDPLRFSCLPGVTAAWDAPKMVALYELVSSNSKLSHAAMADALGYERSTITRKVNSVDWDRFAEVLAELCDMTYDDVLHLEAESVRDREAAKNVVKVRRKEVSNKAFLRELQEAIERSATPLPRQALPKLTLNRAKNKKHSDEHMVLMLSDLHVGQEFSPQDTGGLGGYDVEVFKERASNLRSAVLEILSLHSEVRQVPVLHVMGLGDFVQGANLAGEWGPAYTTLDITQQAIMAAQVVSEMLDAWSAYFERVEFDGVLGNHGRAGVSKSSDKVSANWDLISYKLLQALLQNRPNINVNYSQAWWQTKTINDWEFLLVHGDYISQNINSIYKEELSLQNLVSGATRKPFDYLCLGHFHSFSDLQTTRGEIMVNGSFVGGDIYSMHQLRKASRPTQSVFGVHPEHGKTWNYKINLDFKRE